MGGGMSGLRRSLHRYQGCKAEAIAAGSQAQMMHFVDDAKSDIATLSDALRNAQQVLAILIDPDSQHVSSMQVFAQATAAEAKARAALIEAGAA